jgi:hypothetical protein
MSEGWMSEGWGAVIAAIVGLAASLFVYWLQQRQTNRKPFLQRQLDLCFKATEAAACLASTTDKDKWKKARATFWQLYWGPLSIVESPEVEAAMVAFGNKLVLLEKVANPTLPMTALQVPSYELAHTTRDLILKSWGVHLASLENLRVKESRNGAEKVDRVNPKLQA